MIKTLHILPIFVLLSACQTLNMPKPQNKTQNIEKPKRQMTPLKLKQKYPEAQYISEHVIAFSGSPHQAEDEAKNRVSARIKSQISSEYLSFQQQISANQGTENYAKESSKIIVTTDFKYAELIQIDVDAKQCEELNSGLKCDAFAYLERQKAVDRYLPDFQPRHIKLGQLVDQISQPQIANRDFIALYQQIQMEFSPWLEDAFQIEMISPGFIKNFQALKQAVYNLEKRKNQIIQNFKLKILPAKIDQSKIGIALNEQLIKQLKNLGINASIADKCPKEGLALQFSAQIQEIENSQLLGKKMLTLQQITIVLIDCQNQQVNQEGSLADIKAYEVLNRSLTEQLIMRIQKEVFNPNEKGNLYDALQQQIKSLIATKIPL